MGFRLLADGVVLIHLLFVAFVVCGGFLVHRWRRLMWFHIPAALWGAAIEFGGWVCPLTPLEDALRVRAGFAGYAGGFVEHYLIPLLYPAGLEPPTQAALGTFVIAVNAVAYAITFLPRKGHT